MYVLDRFRDAQAAGELPGTIKFSTYENDKMFARFHPAEDWPSGAAISREFPVMPISEEEYRAWLDVRGLKDSPEILAKYISELLNEDD